MCDSRHAQKRIQQVLAQGEPSPSAKHIRSAKQQHCHSKRSGFLGAVLSRPAKQQGEYRCQPCPVADAAQQDQSQNRSGFQQAIVPVFQHPKNPKADAEGEQHVQSAEPQHACLGKRQVIRQLGDASKQQQAEKVVSL